MFSESKSVNGEASKSPNEVGFDEDAQIALRSDLDALLQWVDAIGRR